MHGASRELGEESLEETGFMGGKDE